MPGFAADDPVYLDGNVPMDALFNALMEVASEVWVLRDRFAVLEELLDERGSITRADIDLHQPGPATRERLAEERRIFLERLLESVAAAR
ncbi:hypothetical protein E1281_26810 [Actinomadura sp. KC345]|uniref:hypothetical protein n=1 Tax=Actinomadura sp. KC345 TaxID=2530371 RepID=UPI0010531C31|nr:hypothetical protein [Actinomadura sp. KC345]TDC47070.1 hypothetical protein E1281_26810 [Actinomadura sp. KC345]